MKLYKKLPGIFILILITATLSAQNNYCNFRKTYPVKKGTTLRLSNKYGDVNVITGKDDSLSVCTTITIVQDNDELLKKSIKLININTGKINDTIYISTVYDKKFFSETSRAGRKSFSVDYLIKMPAYMDLGIKDEFGNISVEELSGTLNIKLSQGTLNAKRLTKGNIKPLSSAYVDHGKIMIDDLNWMTLTVLNCPSVSIEKAQAVMITSVISKIRLGDIGSLVSHSKSDSYSISSLNNVISASTYSTIEIGRLNSQLKSQVTYGSLSISDLNKGFVSIEIDSRQSRILLKTQPDISFKADIVATDALVEFPAKKYPWIIKTYTTNTTSLLGLAGENKETKSLIRIRATSGKIIIQ